ncbi:MAG: LysR family transcriptional regulator [Pygmaiobacter sp.]
MTLRNLEVFLKVVDCGGMRAAAEELYISQPSVSGAVAELEREYDTLLFERLGRKLYITPAGVTLADYARHLLRLADEMEQTLHNACEGEALRIGATITVGTCVLCDLLEKLPGSAPQVLVNNTETIAQLVQKSVLDIALVEGSVTNPDLIVRPVMEDHLVLICPAAHPFAQRKSVQLAELAGAPMILREEGSGTRKLFEFALEHAGIVVNPVWDCNNTEAILNAVAHGFGLSVLSERLVAPHRRRGKIAVLSISDCDLSRKFSLIYHRDKYIGKRLAKFIELCEDSTL